MTELQPRPAGEIQPTTWGEIAIGHILRGAKDDRLYTVTDEQAGWVRLVSAHPERVVSMRRPGPDTPVDIYVPSEEEALILLRDELGARLLRDIEEREHSIARKLNWRVEPVANNARSLRDHLDMLHGISVDDVLRKHTGTKVNPAPKGQRAKALQELRDLHDEAHADPDLWPMAFPHIHTLDKKET